MTKTDRDTVEALAKRHDDDAGAWAMDGGRSDLARYHRETAATLRALVEERDQAQATAATLWEAMPRAPMPARRQCPMC